jgi:mannose-6-phosphate isomerase-like protein (cupin superfamily)
MYKDIVVTKPWGYEYLAYENDEVGLWFLNIKKNQQTSMHCHPNKTTGLVVLDGEIEVSFLADSRKLTALSKVMIRRGLFHSTKALSDKALIFEIETPKDKHDLVRLNDSYGRAKSTYEGKKFENPKTENDLWIQEPKLGESINYNFAGCNLLVETINDIEVINQKKNSDIIMFLKGGMVRTLEDKDYKVTMAGDVGHGSILKQVSSQLDGVVPQTIVMTITKDE